VPAVQNFELVKIRQYYPYWINPFCSLTIKPDSITKPKPIDPTNLLNFTNPN